MTSILLDATALDTSHRLRGIGRYVQGLLYGLSGIVVKRSPGETCRIGVSGELGADIQLKLLRLRSKSSLVRGCEPGSLVSVHVQRWLRNANFFYWIENRLRMKRDLRRLSRNTALFHSTEPYSLVPSRGRAMRSVATCHDLIPLLFPDLYPQGTARIYYRWAARMYRRVDGIIAISQAVKDSLVDLFDIPPAKISVVHHGVDERFFHSWAENYAGITDHSAPGGTPDADPEHSTIHPPDPPTPEGIRGANSANNQRFPHALRSPYFLYIGGADRRK